MGLEGHWGLERGYCFYLTVPNKSSLALQTSVRYWALLHAPCMPTGCVRPVVQVRARSSPAIATTRMTPRASRMACGPWPRPPLGGGWRCVCEPEGGVSCGLCAALALVYAWVRAFLQPCWWAGSFRVCTPLLWLSGRAGCSLPPAQPPTASLSMYRLTPCFLCFFFLVWSDQL